MTLREATAWALLRSTPDRYRYLGLSVEAAEQMKDDLCEAAGKTGATRWLPEHLFLLDAEIRKQEPTHA